MTKKNDHGASLAAGQPLASPPKSDAAPHVAPKMKRGVLVYISGPMTAKNGWSIEQNTADGVAVYLDLLKRGIPAFSPHLSGAFPSAWTALDHQQWIDYDLAIIDRCTHMLMMGRWQSSKGACMEFEYALDIRLPVAFNVAQLEEMLTFDRERQPSIASEASGSVPSAAQESSNG
jgi:hypothetical protein